MKSISKLIKKIKTLFHYIETRHNLLAEELQRWPEFQEKNNLIPFGFKVYSQNDEDGILQEIFQRIGIKHKIFIEFGVGDGLENNTLYFLIQGWKGLWIEGNKKNYKKIRRGLKYILKTQKLHLINSFVTRENIDKIISENIKENEIDLLSIDIDGNDYHIFDAIQSVKARVIVVEYNAKFPPPLSFCIDYDPQHIWQNDDFLGASLKFWETEMGKKGYSLVACNLSGCNAFFIRNDLLSTHFLAPYTSEKHYQPQRYSLNFYNLYPHNYGSVVKNFKALL